MDVCRPCHDPAYEELSSNSVSVTTPDISFHHSLGDLSMNDLKMCLNEFPPVGKSNKCYVMEDECNDPYESIDKSHEFTSSVGELLFGEGPEYYKTSEVNDSNKSVDESYSTPSSLFTPCKPASAMKGSREKKGKCPKKLSVTWAPDVYDPIPTSVSHFPSSKNQQYRNNSRKYGKNKQRRGGKSSRGGKGKDKKQTRKNGGNANSNKPKTVDDGVSSFSEPEAAGTIEFKVVGADPFCGSSFLKESLNNIHFPVAEATRYTYVHKRERLWFSMHFCLHRSTVNK